MTVALLPLGLIAVHQTQVLQRELAEVRNLNLHARTAYYAQSEREAIMEGLGAAKALTSAVSDIIGDAQACSAVLTRFVAESEGRFSFAEYVPPSGYVECSNRAEPFDVSSSAHFKEFIAEDEQKPRLNSYAKRTGKSGVVASVPVTGTAGGYVTVSIPNSELNTQEALEGGTKSPLELFTINPDGVVLTTTGDLENSTRRLPPAVNLISLTGQGTQRVETRTLGGEIRVFSIIPIVDGVYYAVGSWESGTAQQGSRIALPPSLFPVLMWVISLALVYVAVQMQMVRPLRKLLFKMRGFVNHRTLPDPNKPANLPWEIEAIETQFSTMADAVIRDEAVLMDAMHDKDVLLKEVHHRVKNNLQLISSIVNLQIRQTKNSVVAAALNNVNGRVNAMATVHRRLYQASEMGRIQADDLLRDVINPLLNLAPKSAAPPDITLKFNPVILYPDQAVPTALLVVEAVTNSLKYLGTDESGNRWVTVNFLDLGDEIVEISVANSISSESTAIPEDMAESTGLGEQLIKAFARQLETNVETTREAGEHRIRIRFQAHPFNPES
ncbi:hypothetical protein RC74_12775 [Falsihalocynthiibacter arcticus]|uniref:histidine kinase n=1 Tax=Falsihalocynthiibacter arcticus TaxID=1579316 RepID=A0A126V5P1_9RHOB|nr:hypothetical protein RC74_12775 [Falsihalocynthiibacter arcticus]